MDEARAFRCDAIVMAPTRLAAGCSAISSGRSPSACGGGRASRSTPSRLAVRDLARWPSAVSSSETQYDGR